MTQLRDGRSAGRRRAPPRRRSSAGTRKTFSGETYVGDHRQVADRRWPAGSPAPGTPRQLRLDHPLRRVAAPGEREVHPRGDVEAGVQARTAPRSGRSTFMTSRRGRDADLVQRRRRTATRRASARRSTGRIATIRKIESDVEDRARARSPSWWPWRPTCRGSSDSAAAIVAISAPTKAKITITHAGQDRDARPRARSRRRR